MTEQILQAIKAGDRQRVAELLDEHPELLAARAENGVSAVSLAMYHGQPAIASEFVQRGAMLDVFDAAAVGELARVKELAGTDPASVNAFSSDGFPPLGLAAFFGHRDVVRYLLAKGADANAQARNPMQVRPIHAAAARHDAEIVRVLLDHGADPNARQQMGFTALHAAAQNGDHEVVEVLLARGADRTAATEDGRTPAQLAEAGGHAGLARLLGGGQPKETAGGAG